MSTVDHERPPPQVDPPVQNDPTITAQLLPPQPNPVVRNNIPAVPPQPILPVDEQQDGPWRMEEDTDPYLNYLPFVTLRVSELGVSGRSCEKAVGVPNVPNGTEPLIEANARVLIERPDTQQPFAVHQTAILANNPQRSRLDILNDESPLNAEEMQVLLRRSELAHLQTQQQPAQAPPTMASPAPEHSSLLSRLADAAPLDNSIILAFLARPEFMANRTRALAALRVTLSDVARNRPLSNAEIARLAQREEFKLGGASRRALARAIVNADNDRGKDESFCTLITTVERHVVAERLAEEQARVRASAPNASEGTTPAEPQVPMAEQWRRWNQWITRCDIAEGFIAKGMEPWTVGQCPPKPIGPPPPPRPVKKAPASSSTGQGSTIAPGSSTVADKKARSAASAAIKAKSQIGSKTAAAARGSSHATRNGKPAVKGSGRVASSTAGSSSAMAAGSVGPNAAPANDSARPAAAATRLPAQTPARALAQAPAQAAAQLLAQPAAQPVTQPLAQPAAPVPAQPVARPAQQPGLELGALAMAFGSLGLAAPAPAAPPPSAEPSMGKVNGPVTQGAAPVTSTSAKGAASRVATAKAQAHAASLASGDKTKIGSAEKGKGRVAAVAASAAIVKAKAAQTKKPGTQLSNGGQPAQGSSSVNANPMPIGSASTPSQAGPSRTAVVIPPTARVVRRASNSASSIADARSNAVPYDRSARPASRSPPRSEPSASSGVASRPTSQPAPKRPIASVTAQTRAPLAEATGSSHSVANAVRAKAMRQAVVKTSNTAESKSSVEMLVKPSSQSASSQDRAVCGNAIEDDDAEMLSQDGEVFGPPRSGS